ncbi:endonuclease [Halobacillus trueperi]|uniref:endonuclease n=1 Tax=Halobacillus trueperi TaxID=156205 RepID=UPI00142E792C|nr:endonuclease [Halobacillus trueperi]
MKYKSRITGKLLGDGSITKQTGRKPRFQFIHTISDRGWCEYCYDNLKEVIPLQPPRPRRNIDKRLSKGYSESVQSQSKTSTIICYLESQWYKDRKKILPTELIEESLTVESLAWWYQDDGHLKIQNHQPVKIILSTESFTREENEQLISLLYKKFHLVFSIDGKNRIALYNRRSIQYFLHLITPFIHSSMNRKTFEPLPVFETYPEKRTTLYFSNSLQFKEPTKHINDSLHHLERIWEICKSGEFYTSLYPSLLPELNRKGPKRYSYQVKLTSTNTSYLQSLKAYTGLTYSELTSLCLDIEEGPQN